MPEPAHLSARHVVGIDLGTSHVAVAHVAIEAAVSARISGKISGDMAMLPLPQLVAPGQVDAHTLLPALRYHPAAGELDAASHDQPWPTWQAPADAALAHAVATYVHHPMAQDDAPAVLGAHARALGAQVPGRLVSSAKSWLSHAGVDRTAAILPWGAPAGVAKISPLHATASYLAHVQSAWNQRFPDAPLAQQAVCITVPASFDEGARALTLEAARLVGLHQVHLLEEPQAAMTDWLQLQGRDLGTRLAGAKLVLVVDVGGGTTDFSLMAVTLPAAEQAQAQAQAQASGDGVWPQIDRMAVGDHLMLGGDNMDLAIAHALEAQLAGATRLSAARFAQLVQQSRAAKERLLAHDAPESMVVTLLGAGAQVLGASRSATLTRAQVQQWVVDGFMPEEAMAVAPKKRQSGLVSFGLPYPADSAITRHLAAFLTRHADAMRAHLGMAAGTLPVPDAVLFNGGVFHADALAKRLTAVLAAWRGAPLAVLHNPHPDWAVARGAVTHVWEKYRSEWVLRQLAQNTSGKAVVLGQIDNQVPSPRIRAGSARSYFLWLESADANQAGQAICLLPRGQAVGEAVHLAQRFALRLGQSVRFQLLASSLPGAWQAGDVADVAALDAVWLPPLVTRLGVAGQASAEPAGGVQEVAVQLQARMGELGTLEVACVAVDAPAATAGAAPSWPLVFAVRGAQAAHAAHAAQATPADTARTPTAIWPAVHTHVLALLDEVFGAAAQTPQAPPAHSSPQAPPARRLRQRLEKLLGPRETWPVEVLRPLFDVLMARSRRRRRSAEHERVWLNLAGFCLRPGFGAPRDAERMAALWALYEEGLSFAKGKGNWAEWWVLWRRVAAGLNEAQQMAVMAAVAQVMEHADQRLVAKDSPLVAYDDMVRLVAVLENLSAGYRAELGEWLLQRLARPGEGPQTWWALGRTGAREPLHGSPHNVVAPELVAPWIEAALAQDWRRNESAMFAAVQMTRLTGDRARDVDEVLRAQVLQQLQRAKAPERWLQLVTQVVALDADDLKRSVGEALPPGLRLLAPA